MDTEVTASVRGPARSADAEPSTGGCRLVCEECGRVDPLHDARITRALERLLRRVPLARAEYELTVYGLCERCSD
jgi:Fe2+ or Zn2+ uptake regulation protein